MTRDEKILLELTEKEKQKRAAINRGVRDAVGGAAVGTLAGQGIMKAATPLTASDKKALELIKKKRKKTIKGAAKSVKNAAAKGGAKAAKVVTGAAKATGEAATKTAAKAAKTKLGQSAAKKAAGAGAKIAAKGGAKAVLKGTAKKLLPYGSLLVGYNILSSKYKNYKADKEEEKERARREYVSRVG